MAHYRKAFISPLAGSFAPDGNLCSRGGLCRLQPSGVSLPGQQVWASLDTEFLNEFLLDGLDLETFYLLVLRAASARPRSPASPALQLISPWLNGYTLWAGRETWARPTREGVARPQ